MSTQSTPCDSLHVGTTVRTRRRTRTSSPRSPWRNSSRPATISSLGLVGVCQDGEFFWCIKQWLYQHISMFRPFYVILCHSMPFYSVDIPTSNTNTYAQWYSCDMIYRCHSDSFSSRHEDCGVLFRSSSQSISPYHSHSKTGGVDIHRRVVTGSTCWMLRCQRGCWSSAANHYPIPSSPLNTDLLYCPSQWTEDNDSGWLGILPWAFIL